MKATPAQKALWMLGVMTAWGLSWILLGLRAAALIKEQPHPFLEGVKLSGIMLNAVLTWAFTALAVSLIIGLITGFISLVGVGVQSPSHLSYKKGCLIGTATLLWFHGVLYAMVPGALATLPGLKLLPMALSLLLLLGTGAGLMAWAVWSGSGTHRSVRLAGILLGITLLILVPHDVFRRFMPGPAAMPDGQRRLLVVSFDALRKDTFERAAPDWQAPAGVTPICVLPATRLAWNILLGAPAEGMRYSQIMPSWDELQRPDGLTLLRAAELKGIRTAFVINDSLTPAYGLQPNLFTTVLEPEGGWKYWFTLGFGSCWPVYSWAQNYLSPVETSNLWCDTDAYYRDIGRQLKNHGWVSSHNCELHSPIVLKFEELHAISGWKWLWRSAYSYKAYANLPELERDQGRRISPRASAQRHFEARAKFLLNRLRPFLEEWNRRYPELSGLVTADHGESFPGIMNAEHELVSTLCGVHGFSLSSDTILVPLHMFGRTAGAFKSGSVFSWLDLRDGIQDWLGNAAPLRLSGSTDGRSIRMRTIRAIHLERQQREAARSGTNGSFSPEKPGLHPKDILSSTTFLPNGTWFYQDLSPRPVKNLALSTALVQGEVVVTYNPEGNGMFTREDWKGYGRVGRWSLSQAQVEKEAEAFDQRHQLPAQPKD